MDQKLLDTILKNTYTLSQLKHRLSLLKNHLLQTLFGSKELILTEYDSAWLKSLPSEFFQNFDKNNVYKIFDDLEKQITKLKALTIYLTFEPDEEILSQIGLYTRKVFERVILLDIKYDPRLIAGASLVWNGLYRDYSLRARIEERKMLISESFKKFLR